jgi:hypothetical protein
MNMITPSENPSVVSSAQPIRRTSAWANLVRKECLDSREAAIAGLAIFWLVPAVLGLIELALDGRHSAIPFAWLLVIGAGWLYAIIVGAHTVCRDWGKAEEHFLLAQPVSPRTVVSAKLITAAALVAGVLGIAVAWDMMLVQWTAFAALDNPEWMPIIFSAACVMATGFAVAFAVAVMTRQMLASTVVATLVLLVWAIAPLLSSRLAHFWVPALLLDVQHPTTVVPFVLVSFLIVAVSIVASIQYSTHERVFQLGHKQLAWTAGLVMLALFGLATTEVGGSLHVRDQAVLPDFESSAWWAPRTAQRGNRFAFAYCDYRPQSRPMERWFMATFRVSDSGHIQDLRKTPIPGTLPPINPGPQSRVDEFTGLAADKDGHLVVSGTRLHIVSATRHIEPETLWRTTLTWPDGGKPEVLSHAELALPAGEHFRTTESRYEFRYESWNEGRDHVPRFSYLISVVFSTDGNAVRDREDKLYVFDWSDGPNPGPRYVIPLPQDNSYVSVGNGKVHVWAAHGPYPDEHTLVADFDADHPETLLDKQNWSFHERRDMNEYPWIRGLERLGAGSIQVDQHDDVAYLSDWLGLRVARQTRPGRWEIVGECRTSPLAMLFRSIPQPQAIDDSLVIERGEKGIIAYDVSNPIRSRRIGFISAVVVPPWSDTTWSDITTVLATDHYVLLREFNLITALDRPDRRGNGNP